MRRKIPALAALLAFVCALSASATPATAAGSCIDSWAADGHSGPWYTGSNKTLHGNTVHISCPSSSTPWAVDYFVFKTDGNNIYFPINVQDRTGHGSTSWSVAASPVGCNAGWRYGTQVYNRVTGGNIEKPNVNGQVIC